MGLGGGTGAEAVGKSQDMGMILSDVQHQVKRTVMTPISREWVSFAVWLDRKAGFKARES